MRDNMEHQDNISVQDKYAQNSICFGCGPANEKGLQIKSFRTENGLKMEFETKDEHQAFPGIINGGIISTLLDCHGNWSMRSDADAVLVAEFPDACLERSRNFCQSMSPVSLFMMVRSKTCLP